MCLSAINGQEMTAERPILVYKLLKGNGLFSKLTPFMNFKIDFKHGRSQEYTSELRKIELNFPRTRIVEINEGFHAIYNKTIAELLADSLVWHKDIKTKVYYAVIPKGAKYYVGDSHDIVSDRQIIFRTKWAFKKSEYSNCKPLYKE